MMRSTNRPNIVVIGSANIDLVATAASIPAPGQTVIADGFRIVHGGKGANQAVAVARLGESVAMIGCVGDDDFGRNLRSGLSDAGVNCSHLRTLKGLATGVALIVVSQSGQNSICVAPGANHGLTRDDIDRAEPVIAAARICVLQLEIPIDVALHAINVARRHRAEVILDPAPAPREAPAELFQVDILTPNSTEAAELVGLPGDVDPAVIAAVLRDRGADSVALKLGANGAYLSEATGDQAISARSVEVVDTTGAGDAFTAALAVARARGEAMPDAVRFAVAAGSLACTKFGAQPSMPAVRDVDAFLAS